MKGMGLMPQQKRKPMSEINVVPYIDVMLVLLIIFMVTAPMLTQGVKVDLPQTTSDPIQQDKDVESITVSVDANRSEEHTSELQSRPHLVCRLLLEKKKE